MVAKNLIELFGELRDRYFADLEPGWKVEITDDEGYCERGIKTIRIKENSDVHDPKVVLKNDQGDVTAVKYRMSGYPQAVGKRLKDD
jgi:hypothetical protein